MKLQLVFPISYIAVFQSFICYHFLYLLPAMPKLFQSCEIDNKKTEKHLGIFFLFLYKVQKLFHQKWNNWIFLSYCSHFFVSAFSFADNPLQGKEEG